MELQNFPSNSATASWRYPACCTKGSSESIILEPPPLSSVKKKHRSFVFQFWWDTNLRHVGCMRTFTSPIKLVAFAKLCFEIKCWKKKTVPSILVFAYVRQYLPRTVLLKLSTATLIRFARCPLIDVAGVPRLKSNTR